MVNFESVFLEFIALTQKTIVRTTIIITTVKAIIGIVYSVDTDGGGIGAGGGYGGIGTKLVDVIGRVILVIVVRPNSICARVLLLASSFALAITASRLTVPIVVMFTVATTLPEVNVTSTLPAVKPNVDITLD